jgi:predicted RNA-binding Zn-ribbon protein involved in translation (DUF1610 family)
MARKELYQKRLSEGKCPSCGKERDSEFLKCLNCRESEKRWKDKNKDKLREYERLRHKTNPSHYSLEARQEVIKFLGIKCSNSNCPIPQEKIDIRGLEIDHVNNNGNEDRRKIGFGYSYYKKILERVKEGSKDYQVLCAYCNRIKRSEARE